MECTVVLVWLTGPGQESSYMDELGAAHDIAGVGVDVCGAKVR